MGRPSAPGSARRWGGGSAPLVQIGALLGRASSRRTVLAMDACPSIMKGGPTNLDTLLLLQMSLLEYDITSCWREGPATKTRLNSKPDVGAWIPGALAQKVRWAGLASEARNLWAGRREGVPWRRPLSTLRILGAYARAGARQTGVL